MKILAFYLMHACSVVFDSVTSWTVACLVPWSMGFPRQEYWVGCHFFAQGIFPTQGSNPCLLHGQADSLSLSHLGSPLVKRSVTNINHENEYIYVLLLLFQSIHCVLFNIILSWHKKSFIYKGTLICKPFAIL